MPNLLGLVLHNAARNRTNININPAHSGNGARVDDDFFHLFDTDQTYNGEDFTAGSLLIGDNSVTMPNVIFTGSSFTFRSGTTEIATWNANGMFTSREFGMGNPLAVNVGAGGNIQLDRQGHSLVRITAATGNFTIQTITNAGRDGTELLLINDTTFNMTLKNNSAVGTAGASDIFTLLAGGADITLVGFSNARFVYVENIGTPGTFQWMVTGTQG